VPSINDASIIAQVEATRLCEFGILTAYQDEEGFFFGQGTHGNADTRNFHTPNRTSHLVVVPL